ncbi:MAG: pantetheine-phosphate adenylyltransferase [Deltaproteobacteria bacterium RIFCSPLOWO2_02_FULL_50_16]|nr:MAG: pantetheine-phosphate adenylyltransferase [Deltaproteobacteria bacterium GWA2_50_8]OGQ29517.1 MAG: pantetheine-phosphate adenylyltransferase [Deltaproteobacteria bacterium RIFCSPHIGHO2_02_FULL_50_15]OGQ57324.1 MAG: pantetheine-phosphate adenylyltransferase [Deltaproteobacteria bacterium RIFCSPLOWO2_02_FULL_50_16]OGQ68258.1 MAG: pantetheine-phosphate adenylyltransferase [Deltaproteobacteria bacterium RIFCSPLOWO2_12_FULL_50_11]
MGNAVIYPGSFDPPTEGHMNVIERASKVFDRVIVAVAINSTKQSVFTPDERVSLLKKIFKDNASIEVDKFEDRLLVDYAKSKKVNVIIRGLRTVSDYEFENQMSLANRKLAPNIEILFMMAESRYSHFSSSLIKEIARLGGPVEGMLDPSIAKKLKEKLLK